MHGAPATPDTLLSEAGTGALTGYTIFYGVPEPGSLLLLGLGAALLLPWRRRR